MNFSHLCRVRPTWLLLLGLLALVPLHALAQAVPADENAAAARRSGTPRPPAEPRFAIELQTGDGELRDFLLRNLELQRYQRLRDLDDAELGRLLANAPNNLRDLLGTRGHFTPVIDIALVPAQTTIGQLLAHVRRGDVVAVHSLRRGATDDA